MPPIQSPLLETINDVHDLCAHNNVQLVFLTIFGAALYGTQSSSSDLDIRGIFIPIDPSPIQHSIHISSNISQQRNSASDVDIDLYSIQRWLQDLAEGSINALDILYAPTNTACTLHLDARLQPVFAQPLRYYNVCTDACRDYAIRQAQKYGCKGSRAGALYAVHSWLEKNLHNGRDKLREHTADIISHCGVPALCYEEKQGTDVFLVVCGKAHHDTITLAEFKQRIARDVKPHISAIEDARQGTGLDYKALSHALRAFLQTEELLATGSLTFPLRYAERIQQIKNGQTGWPEIDRELESFASRIRTLQMTSSYNREFVPEMGNAFLRSLYGETNQG